MKRLFAVLAILAVLLSAGLCVLSCVPHCHGTDFDHSGHKSCPVYQFSLHGFDAAIPFAHALMLLAVLRFLAEAAAFSLRRPVLLVLRSRAPPSL